MPGPPDRWLTNVIESNYKKIIIDQILSITGPGPCKCKSCVTGLNCDTQGVLDYFNRLYGKILYLEESASLTSLNSTRKSGDFSHHLSRAL